MAVGAGRARVLRQLLVESLVLAVLGSAAGLLLARLGVAAILRIDRHAIPRLVETTIDGRVLAVVLGMSVLTALAFGLAPAFSLWKTEPHDALKSGNQMMSPGTSSLRTRRILVAGEVALALMLLIGAGLMAKSAWRMYDYPPGFRARARADGEDRVRRTTVTQNPGAAWPLPMRCSAVSGVSQASWRRVSPRTATCCHPDWWWRVIRRRTPEELDQRPPIMINATSASLKQVMGLRMLRGRWFTDGEAAAVLNDSLARREMPGRDPIGKRIQVSDNGPWLTIVGVVADLKYSQLDAAAEPEVYVPYSTHRMACSASPR